MTTVGVGVIDETSFSAPGTVHHVADVLQMRSTSNKRKNSVTSILPTTGLQQSTAFPTKFVLTHCWYTRSKNSFGIRHGIPSVLTRQASLLHTVLPHRSVCTLFARPTTNILGTATPFRVTPVTAKNSFLKHCWCSVPAPLRRRPPCSHTVGAPLVP